MRKNVYGAVDVGIGLHAREHLARNVHNYFLRRALGTECVNRFNAVEHDKIVFGSRPHRQNLSDLDAEPLIKISIHRLGEEAGNALLNGHQIEAADVSVVRYRVGLELASGLNGNADGAVEDVWEERVELGVEDERRLIELEPEVARFIARLDHLDQLVENFLVVRHVYASFKNLRPVRSIERWICR